jgi:protein pelota
MKIEARRIERDGSGFIKLFTEIPEDMWHVYNLIGVGDIIKSSTYRKVQKATGDTGSSVQEKVRITVSLQVDAIDFDVQSSEIRLKGRNVEESDFLKVNQSPELHSNIDFHSLCVHFQMGQFHTIELSLNKPFSITKTYWDAIYLDRIKLACDPAQSAEIAAVVMQQGFASVFVFDVFGFPIHLCRALSGLAHVCLLTTHMTVVRARIEISIPKKRIGSSHHDKAVQRFYENILEAIVRHVDFEKIKVVILASPAFIKVTIFISPNFFRFL